MTAGPVTVQTGLRMQLLEAEKDDKRRNKMISFRVWSEEAENQHRKFEFLSSAIFLLKRGMFVYMLLPRQRSRGPQPVTLRTAVLSQVTEEQVSASDPTLSRLYTLPERDGG